ncbi:MAG: desulfoferrodoxin [bacterium]|nr:desulfoferrodoxin [bacterium]
MPAKRYQVFKCQHCGNIVDVVHGAAGTLVCCNNPMTHQEENTTDAAQEKHVPVIEKTDSGFKVTVGSVEHPMADDHYIEWIELLVDGRVCRKFMDSGDKPEAYFPISGRSVTARAYCNLHGFWKSESA